MERSWLWLDAENKNRLGENQTNAMEEWKQNIKEHPRTVLARDNQGQTGSEINSGSELTHFPGWKFYNRKVEKWQKLSSVA